MSSIDRSQRVIYLDNAATTPCDPRVIEAITPYFFDNFGNPSSPHVMGQLAHQLIDDKRIEILSLLRGRGDLIFTSGSTESNNLGIYSLLRYVQERLARKRVLCLSTEHKSIVNAVTYFGKMLEVTVDWIPVTDNGLIDMQRFSEAMDSSVGAVIVQLANSETGVIQDLSAISGVCKKFGAKVFSDITQGLGRIEVDLTSFGVDYASFTAHKFYGPKGIGALYVAPGLPVSPVFFGGGQEKGVRPGTENVPGIIGMAKAMNLVVEEFEFNQIRLSKLRDRLWGSLVGLGGIRWNGSNAPLLPTHLNVTVNDVNAQDLMLRARGVAFSAGSACNTSSNTPSPVLLAMGLSRSDAEQTVRLSVGKFNAESDIERAAHILTETIAAIRKGA